MSYKSQLFIDGKWCEVSKYIATSVPNIYNIFLIFLKF
jgi:hypothetical protein